MKSIYKTLSLFTIAACGVAMASCEKDLDTYAGENGIYFDTFYKGAETLSDTIDVSWGMNKSSVTSQNIELVVKLFGNTMSVDRAFDIVIEDAPTYVPNKKTDTSTENGDEIETGDRSIASRDRYGDEETVIPTMPAEADVDYIISSTHIVMPAGQAEVSIPVTLLRRPDLHLTKRSFKVRLIENEHLKFLFSRGTFDYDAEGEAYTRPMDYQRVIRMDEEFPCPVWWPIRGLPYFGEWSQTKAVLICDICDIDRELWLSIDGLSLGRIQYYGQKMYKYLEQKKAEGNPVLEDDGKLMEMGTQSVI